MSHSSGTIGIVNRLTTTSRNPFSRGMLIAIPAIFTVPVDNQGIALNTKRKKEGREKGKDRVTEERSVTDSRTTNGTEDRELLEEEPCGKSFSPRSSTIILARSLSLSLRCDYFLPDTRLTYFLQQYKLKFHVIVVVR